MNNAPHARPGMILLFVVMATTVLTILSISSWRIACQLHAYALKRALFHERICAARALLHYAIAYCAEHVKQCLQEGEKKISIAHWPCIESVQKYSAQLHISVQDEQNLMLVATVYDSASNKKYAHCSCKIQCIIHTDEHYTIRMSNYEEIGA